MVNHPGHTPFGISQREMFPLEKAKSFTFRDSIEQRIGDEPKVRRSFGCREVSLGKLDRLDIVK